MMDLSPLVSFGVSTVGSLVTGYMQKHYTPLNNKAIPATNPALWSGSTAAVTNDPSDVAGAFVGSLVAWGVHRVYKKLKS